MTERNEVLSSHELDVQKIATDCRALMGRAGGLGDRIAQGNDGNTTLAFDISDGTLNLTKKEEGGIQEDYTLMEREGGYIELKKKIESLDGTRQEVSVVRDSSDSGLRGVASEYTRADGETARDELYPAEISSVAVRILKDLSDEIDKRDLVSIEARDSRVERILTTVLGESPAEESADLMATPAPQT